MYRGKYVTSRIRGEEEPRMTQFIDSTGYLTHGWEMARYRFDYLLKTTKVFCSGRARPYLGYGLKRTFTRLGRRFVRNFMWLLQNHSTGTLLNTQGYTCKIFRIMLWVFKDFLFKNQIYQYLHIRKFVKHNQTEHFQILITLKPSSDLQFTHAYCKW